MTGEDGKGGREEQDDRRDRDTRDFLKEGHWDGGKNETNRAERNIHTKTRERERERERERRKEKVVLLIFHHCPRWW